MLSTAALSACENDRPEGNSARNNFPPDIGYAPGNQNPKESDTVVNLAVLKKMSNKTVQEDVSNTPSALDCCAGMDQNLLKNIRENAVLDYLSAEQTKQAAKDEHRKTLLKGIAIGVAAAAGAGTIAIAVPLGCKVFHRLMSLTLF